MRPYAVVLTCDKGYFPGLAAVINGVALYGTPVDLHLVLAPNVPPAYKENLPDFCKIVPWKDVPPDPSAIKKKSMPWAVRFFRYRHASQIVKDYKAIMVLDSDMLIVDDFSSAFETAVKTNELCMVRNLLGIWPPEIATVKNVKNAVSPPCHCTGTVFTPRFQHLLEQTWEWGVREGYGDMATLFKTIIRTGYDVKKIQTRRNELWVWTRWFSQPCKLSIEDGKAVVRLADGERVIMVHGKWWTDHMRRKEGGCKNDPGEMSDEEILRLAAKRPKAMNILSNIKVFKQALKWLYANGPIKWSMTK